MAASTDRFSIRDYAAKMRIVDLARSWPFVGEINEKSPLPPISICRFRWWADELSAAKSVAEAAEIKGAEALINELVEEPNEIIDPQPPKSPLTKGEELRSPKGKTRMPKKRSIVELFASAPQIDPASSAVDQSNGENDDGESKEEEEEKVMVRNRTGKRREGAIKAEIRPLKKVE